MRRHVSLASTHASRGHPNPGHVRTRLRRALLIILPRRACEAPHHAGVCAHRYYQSSWRRDTQQVPGGFLLDSAVHHMAALRLVAAGDEPVSARAVCTTSEDAPSNPETLVGSISWSSGMISSVSLCTSTSLVRAQTAPASCACFGANSTPCSASQCDCVHATRAAERRDARAQCPLCGTANCALRLSGLSLHA